MELTEAQYARIQEALPVQRGNVSLTNLQLLNALLYVLENGCKWRGLPRQFGNWHTIYTRMNRWAKNGVLDRVFARLQLEQIVRIRIEAIQLDSTSIKVHPDAAGAPKKMDRRPSAAVAEAGLPSFISFAADARTALSFALSPGNAHDAPEGRALLEAQGPMGRGLPLLMDRAYEDRETRELARSLGMEPVVPPKRNRRAPWLYDRELYKKRNEIERLFRRLKEYRRVHVRFDKLDTLYLGFVCFAFIVEMLRKC